MLPAALAGHADLDARATFSPHPVHLHACLLAGGTVIDDSRRPRRAQPYSVIQI
jgi:hypothetical protein